MTKPWWTFAASWILVALMMSAWAVATPLSAAPDEPAHLIKAASVARGQLIGEPSTQGNVVQVPQYVASSHDRACFIFEPDVTADCSADVKGESGTLVDATTTAGLYNPVYYALIGWPSLIFQDSSGIYAMRIVSGILCALFVALSITLVSQWRSRRLPLLSLAVAVTPMVLFLGGTVNPNSIETAATMSAFVAAITLVREPAQRSWNAPIAVLAASISIAANTRGLSLLWVAVAVLAPLLLLDRTRFGLLVKSTPVRIGAIVATLATAFALYWLFVSNSLGAAIDDPAISSPYPYVGASPVLGFFLTLELTASLNTGIIGVFGWLDTPAPPTVYFIWSAFIGALLLAGFSILKRAELRFVAVLAVASLFLPPLVQGLYISGGGLIWQGRYTLPLFVCLIVGIGAALASRFDGIESRIAGRISSIVLVAWAGAQFYSFAIALRRYAVGYTHGWSDLLTAPAWQPPGGAILWLALALLLISGAATALWLLARPDKAKAP